MELLAAIEQLGPVRLLKTSFFVYPIVNALHIAAIGAVFTGVVLLDLRLLGSFGSLPKQPFVALFRRLTLAAFGLAALTGVALFSVKASEYAGMPVFLLKLGLIAAAAANFLAFVALDGSRKDEETTSFPLRVSAMTSMMLWSGVLLCGRFIGFL